MWTKERLLQAMADTPQLCVLLLRPETDGTWLCFSLSESGAEVPCRKAQGEKAAMRRMAEICLKTVEKNCRVTIAHTDDLTAAYLAGQLRKSTAFAPLDPALGRLALLYPGSLRSSPLV